MTPQYAHVFLLNACDKLLTYHIPAEHVTTINTGSIVRVPLQQRYEYAIVQSISSYPHTPISRIKSICSTHATWCDPYYLQFLDKLSVYYAIDRRTIFRRIRQSLGGTKRKHDIGTGDRSQERTLHSEHSIDLNTEQQYAYDAVVPHIRNSRFYPALLHGVTGSGKTHVYAAISQTCLHYDQACVWISPEVTLAIELERRIKQQFPHIPCYGFHSATSRDEKRSVWRAIYQQQPCIIIGVHLPIMLPIAHLGCIIIDEEHDAGLQEKKHPKIHTKEAAIIRARTYHIPIIMGSATPSMQSLYNVERGTWGYFRLQHRYHGSIAPITIAYLTRKEKRTHFWITKTLEHAIQDRLDRGEQTIIFLNRRGYNFFIRCGSCGYTFCCTHCSVSLTPHQRTELRCHYCHRSWQEPQYCTSCRAHSTQFVRKGIGTQQATRILANLFPHARIARADLDTTVHKKRWQSTVQAFTQGHIDILVGTQTITKGYDFPNVTLVGLLWADINLGMPVYNTAERTLQQILQVAGRAGRGDNDSRVIAQVMLDHTLLSYAHEDYYESYYQYEMQFRKYLRYPPFARFASIELRHEDEYTVSSEAENIYHTMQQHVSRDDTILLGPTQPTVSRIEGVHIRMIYIKSAYFDDIYAAYTSIQPLHRSSRIFFNPSSSE